MIQVEKDVEAAINIINLKKVNSKEYRPIKLFTDRSLKFLKKYRLNERKISLTKYNSGDEVIDLLCYGSDVCCYSSNRLDEYFLNLKLAMFYLDKMDDYYNYFFNDYSKKQSVFSMDIYNKIKNKLDDKSKYFFDELFSHVSKYDILNTKLFYNKNYSYKILVKYIKYLLKYNKVQDIVKNKSVDFKICTDGEVSHYFDTNTFNFINLSYNIDSMNDEKIRHISNKINEIFVPLLKENGKIQGFTSKKETNVDGYTRLETRSMDDPNTIDKEYKKEYAYMYKN